MKIDLIPESGKAPPKQSNKIKYIPSFIKGETVTLLREKAEYSPDLKKIIGMNLKVDRCKLSNLEDMLVEVVYLNTDINTDDKVLIRNPYIASHFIKIEENE